MNHHKLKLLPEHYNNVLAGTKTFEIRKNDRAYQKGDFITLYYWVLNKTSEDTDIYHFTNSDTPSLNFKIGDVYPIDAERVVFSLLPITEQGRSK